jgi:ferrous iron transport protein A
VYNAIEIESQLHLSIKWPVIRPKGGKMPMPLSMAERGRELVLQEIRGGIGIRRRLTDMGLHPGSHLKVISNSGRGPFVISVGDTKLMIGRGMAHKIMVELP